MPFDAAALIGQFESSPRTKSFAYRDRAELPFDVAAVDPAAPLMLDTTVYIDALQAPGLPHVLAALIAQGVVLHSAVAAAELAVSLGHLGPTHGQTKKHKAPIVQVLTAMSPDRVLAPSAAAWIEAAMIAGTLARTQSLPREARRKLLNDALLLLTAIESGATLISRNVNDFDLLLRFKPKAQVLLYDRETR